MISARKLVGSLGIALVAAGTWTSDATAEGLKAVAEMKGCTNPAISGTATLVEQTTPEGIKEVTVEMTVKGLTDGKHAVHIHEVASCEPCGSAGGHHDPGPFGQSRPDSATDDVPAADINQTWSTSRSRTGSVR